MQIVRDVDLVISFNAPLVTDNVSSIQVRYQLGDNGAYTAPATVIELFDGVNNSMSLPLLNTIADDIRVELSFINAAGASAYSTPVEVFVLPTVPVPSVPSGVTVTAV